MNILILGNYFSKSRGTMPVMERVAKYLGKEYHGNITIASEYKNKILRLLDLSFHALFAKYDTAIIDVFSGNSFHVANLCSFLVKLRGKKCIGTLRGGKLPEFSAQNIALTKKLFNRLDKILSPSMFLKDHYKDWGYEVQHMPNPVNLEHFPFKERPSNKKHAQILWVRAFTSIYNPTIPVQAIKLLLQEFPEIQLTMVGPDLGLMDSTKALVKELTLEEHVTFTGGVPNHQLSDYLNSHDIFLNTTSYESFGMAVMEAAACGIPIISTAVGEIPLLWEEEKNILLTEGKTPEAFATQIKRILQSKELSKSLAQNARKKAEQFDWELIKLKWLDLLQKDGQLNG